MQEMKTAEERLRGFMEELPNEVRHSIRNGLDSIYLSSELYIEYSIEVRAYLKRDIREDSQLLFKGIPLKKVQIGDFIYVMGSDYFFYLKMGNDEIIKLSPSEFMAFICTYTQLCGNHI